MTGHTERQTDVTNIKTYGQTERYDEDSDIWTDRHDEDRGIWVDRYEENPDIQTAMTKFRTYGQA